jgi:ribose transport system ATP-binding protein
METIRAEKISIAFPGVKALTDVDFSVQEGEIRALVGKNGAGKSTLIKIITGMYKPNVGRIFISGTEVKHTDPEIMAKLGIKAIYQDNDLIPYFTVGESIMLGREARRGPFLDRKKMHETARAILYGKIGVNIDPYTTVSELNVSSQQLIQIAACLVERPKIMIFDEPTASLSVKEIDKLFEIIASLKKSGVSVIYISHRFGEVFKIADTITILTDGMKIADMNLADTTEDKVISLMAGNEQFSHVKTRKYVKNGQDIALSVRNMHNAFLRNINFDLHRGEILGFFGGEGMGQQQVARSVYGGLEAEFDSLKVFGKEKKISTPAQAIKNGIAYIPRNRLEEGIVRGFSVRENVTLPKLHAFSKSIFIDEKAEDAITRKHIEKLTIKTPETTTPIANLSGGNQQKVVLARWIVTEPRILILDYPTIGIDIRAKNEVYKILLDLAEQGMSLMLITPEYEEVAMLCDRVIVMRDGKIRREIEANELSEYKLLSYAIGSGEDEDQNAWFPKNHG